MDKKAFFNLLDRYKEGATSPGENKLVEEYYRRLEAMGSTRMSPREANALKQKMYRQIMLELKEDLRKPIVRSIPMWRKIAAAVAVLLVLGGSGYLIFRNTRPTQTAQSLPHFKNDVTAPVNTKASITLSNGKTILIDSLASGTLATQGSVTVLKNSSGVVYSSPGSSPDGEAGVRLNTLTNPRGSKSISLTLSDGSLVWLNAASSVTYPTAFTGRERKVAITGEAYFEVVHNPAMPFIVTKGDAEVQVLGTHFNVNAYDDETNIKVTLLEGSVKVDFQAQPEKSITIKPGEQAIVSQAKGELGINQQPDIDEVMAWRHDLFHFESADVQAILRQIARWYDVEVVYEGTPVNKKFFGIISRKSPLSEVLQLLKANNIRFSIEGKKLIVTSR